MQLKEQKRILFFLERLAEHYCKDKKQGIHPQLKKLYSRVELRNIVLRLHKGKWTPSSLSDKSETELLELIGTDTNLLLHTIETLEDRFNAFPKYAQTEVDAFFTRTQNESHYLAQKSVDHWDSYDTSNYRSLLLKTGTTKKVFGVFTSDVLAEDVYAVTTKPSYFFDTEQEAEQEITNIIAEGRFTREELTIHKLWLMQ